MRSTTPSTRTQIGIGLGGVGFGFRQCLYSNRAHAADMSLLCAPRFSRCALPVGPARVQEPLVALTRVPGTLEDPSLLTTTPMPASLAQCCGDANASDPVSGSLYAMLDACVTYGAARGSAKEKKRVTCASHCRYHPPIH